MTCTGALGRARLAFIIGAFVVSACGGSTPTAAPSTAPTAAPPTVAPTETPAPPTPTAAPTVAPTAAAVDPSEDLEIGPPYTLEPLDAAIADMFISAMRESLGSMADVFDVGVKSAVENGETAAWVIVMRFPDMPMTGTAVLDGAAAGAAGETGTVEKQTIEGQPVRIVPGDGVVSVLTMVGDDLVMAISPTKPDGLGVITAILKAN